MFHKESVRIATVAIGVFLALTYVVNTSEPKHSYKIGECFWHIKDSKNPDGTYKTNTFKVVGTVQVEGEDYYITDVLNYTYWTGVKYHELSSFDYIDKYHNKNSRKHKCTNNLTKKASKECLEDENFQFTTGGPFPCPTKEEYCKENECWKK